MGIVHAGLEQLARTGELEPILELIRERQLAGERTLRALFYETPLTSVAAAADLHRQQGYVQALAQLLTALKVAAGIVRPEK